MTVTNRKPTLLADATPVVDLEPGLRVECDICTADITHSVHIRCAADECRATNIDLCPSCFCKGKETRTHKKTHPYRVIERHSYPIFTEDWGADEELLLIDGLLASGMGSWADAAEHIGTRSREEAERHYNEVYVNSPDWPLPNMNAEFEYDLETFQAKKKRRLEEIRSAPVEIPAVAPKPLVSAPTNHEIAGFMPGRLEFETEVDNEAEEQVKDLEFGLVMEYGGADQPAGDPPASIMAAEKQERADEDAENADGDGDVKMSDTKPAETKPDDEDGPPEPLQEETPSSLALKLCLLEMYNEKIDRRLETKAVVFDRGLTEFKKLQAIERKRPKDEREFVNKHKPFARLQTANDFDVFIDGLLYEVALRKRIQELQEYRRMGITSLAEAERYEKDKVARLNFRAMPATRDYRHSTEPDDIQFPGTRYRSGPLTLATSSSLHLLTPQEQLLCSQLRILPKPYLAIKEAIVREYIKKGGKLRKRDAKDMFKIETQKTAKIWEFLEKAGVFKPVAHAAAAASAAALAAAASAASLSNGIGASNAAPNGSTSVPASQISTVATTMVPTQSQDRDVSMHPASQA